MSNAALSLPEPDANLPSPPFISIPGIHNFRDIGGYPLAGTNSKSVRKGLVFRCADPTRITDEGKENLKALGVKKIFDLRSKPEIKKFGGTDEEYERPLVDGIDRVYCPCFKDEDWSPEGIAMRYKDYSKGNPEGFTAAYADILQHAPSAYTRVLQQILENPTEPFVVHCTAGKDRTGVLAMLLLGLAGASDEAIATEYSYTELGLLVMREVIVTHLLKEESLGGERSKAERMVSSRPENMIRTLAMVREKYGSVEGYVRSVCGFNEEDVAKIRATLTADEKPEEALCAKIQEGMENGLRAETA